VVTFDDEVLSYYKMSHMRGWTMIMILLGALQVSAQNTYTKASDSDPKAKVILDKLKATYNGYKSMEVKFDIDLELPNKPKVTQKGTIIQSGTKFQAKMTDQEVFSDGKTTWLYIKKNKEVQIMDAAEGASSAVMSPKQMMTLYEKGEYVYTIVEERTVGKDVWVDIEFKPLKKRSEYSKIRLTIDKKANKMVSLRVFSKDGSKYTLKVNSLTPNLKYDPAIFVFNTKSYPGIHIEDLRMD
jgi:outer membrane lipoprotein-sorting protein